VRHLASQPGKLPKTVKHPWPRFESIDSRQNSFDRSLLNPVCNCPGALVWSGRGGRSKYAHNFDSNNFGPRAGFAWRVAKQWVVRGGGAIVYVGQYDQATPLVANIGFSIRGDFVSPDGGRTAALILRNGLPPIPPPTQADLVPGFGAVPIGQSPQLCVQFFEPDHRPVPYLETFNLNIQRTLTHNMVFEIGYLATLGHKLTAPGTRSINQAPLDRIGPGNAQVRRPFPQYADVRVIAPTVGNSNYHGVNFRIDKRYFAGLHFNANYTWAKLIDDVESRDELGGNAGDNAFANQYDRRADRGLSGNHIGQRIIGSVVWELPVGKDKPVNVQNLILKQIGAAGPPACSSRSARALRSALSRTTPRAFILRLLRSAPTLPARIGATPTGAPTCSARRFSTGVYSSRPSSSPSAPWGERSASGRGLSSGISRF